MATLSVFTKSAVSSMPHETRMNPSVMTFSRSSLSMLAWVMTAGNVMIDSVAPRCSHGAHSRRIEFILLRPASVPPMA